MKKLSLAIATMVALAVPIVARAQDGVALSKQLEISLKAKNDKRRLLESFETDDCIEQEWSSHGKHVQVFVCVYSSTSEATSVMDLALLNIACAAVQERMPGFGEDGHRAADVITRLRALFGRKEGVIERVDLNDATQEVIELMRNDLQRNRVAVRTELAGDLPLVMGDRIQLQQVIMNLIRNASDAMRDIEDRPRQLMITTARNEHDLVDLTVQDSGAGFEPEVMNNLFESFYTTKSDGMGMGLSVSRSIIENHNGQLRAKLNDGAGATFSLSIPGVARSVAAGATSSNEITVNDQKHATRSA